MLLQIAIDRAESFGVIPRVRGIADIIEIGTPLLNRFGIGAIARRASFVRTRPFLSTPRPWTPATLKLRWCLAQALAS